MSRDYDVAVVGGGLLGSAIAWGLARVGQRVAVLDEGDRATRASRANFALVWVQSKGLGMPEYAGWTIRSSNAWGDFADELARETGIGVSFERPGGFHLALSERELEARANILKRLHNQPGIPEYETKMLSAPEIRKMLPDIGPDVVGGSYCPLDGHVNSQQLLRAFHKGLKQQGADYLASHRVEAITQTGGVFLMRTPSGDVRAQKVVLAAGNANQQLAPMVGLDAPMKPERGQIIVTERVQPFLRHPVVTIRQSNEGSVMIGDSKEEGTQDADMTMGVNTVMADRARRMFPKLSGLNVVRMWTGIRVMTEDGFPIYEQSTRCPGAFVACCHSGVTLAANHALTIAPMIAKGQLDPDTVGAFTARRFDVSSPA
ncbi:MAG: NAD(P)/FAD-dependent oxidoreductase [Hyphomicrobiaceae bacterium]